MIPGILEKLGYVGTLALLRWNARIPAIDAQAAVPDFLLAVLFMVAYAKTRPSGLRDA
jgi:hypothetical protein